MLGRNHFALGCACAVCTAYVGMKHNDTALVVSALTMPAGAMFPDIDHPQSKLGRQRGEVEGLIKKASLGVAAGYIGLQGVQGMTAAGIAGLTQGLLMAFVTLLPLIVCVLITTTNKFKKATKFFTKHRGIMHTLIPPIGLIIGSYKFGQNFVAALMLGFAVGYISHLFSDCQTVMGCPVAWPFTSKYIRFPIAVRTNTAAEVVVLLIDIGGLACLAWML